MPRPVRTTKKKTARKGARKVPGFVLPTERRAPTINPWAYAYLITGEKKIGKTSLMLQGCEEFVIQFDKPHLAWSVREECPKSWREVTRIVDALTEAAEAGNFPYERVIVDGVGDMYAMCQEAVCKHFQVAHPKDVGFAAGWHKLRDDFNDVITRLLRLQAMAKCGISFIAHAEWKETSVRGSKEKIEKLVPNLPARCEEIVNGKVDGWFIYDWDGDDRVLVIIGAQDAGAGHRIDGRFMTPDGRRVREIHMGNSAEEALKNFLNAFNNKQEYTTIAELREKEKPATTTRKRTTRKSAKAGTKQRK